MTGKDFFGFFIGSSRERNFKKKSDKRKLPSENLGFVREEEQRVVFLRTCGFIIWLSIDRWLMVNKDN